LEIRGHLRCHYWLWILECLPISRLHSHSFALIVIIEIGFMNLPNMINVDTWLEDCAWFHDWSSVLLFSWWLKFRYQVVLRILAVIMSCLVFTHVVPLVTERFLSHPWLFQRFIRIIEPHSASRIPYMPHILLFFIGTHSADKIHILNL
jgi:hypothetical protein